MPAEYLDISYVVWRSIQESLGHGWGLVLDPAEPEPSGYAPSSFTSRGQSLTSLIESLGTQGRANGVQARPQAGGYVSVKVGPPAWNAYDGVLVDPLNVREESAASSGRGVASVTADGAGETSTVAAAGARFPGHQLVSGDGSNTKALAYNTLQTANKSKGTVTLRARVDLSDLRPGDLVPYIRAGGQYAGAMYLRVVSIRVDESSVQTEFVVVAQIIESDALTPKQLTRGAYWPGTAGNRLVRRATR